MSKVREEMDENFESQRINCIAVLEKVRAVGGIAICAGGFPRDYILNEKELAYNYRASDFDIYIQNDSSKQDIIESFGLNNGNIFQKKEGYEGQNDLDSIFTGTFSNPNNLSTFDRFELIFIDTDDIENYVFKSFDTSICQAYFDGTQFKTSPEFDKTLETKVVTYNTSLSQDLIDYSFKSHVPKLVGKFSDFTFDFTGVTIPKDVTFGWLKRFNNNKLNDKIKIGKRVVTSDNYIYLERGQPIRCPF